MRISPLARAAVVVISALVGFLLVSQVRGRVSDRAFLETASEADLTRILASLNQEASSLREELVTLRFQLQDLETATARDQAAQQAATEQRRSLAVLAGTVPVAGPGVTLHIEDPADAMTAEIFIDIVQELRDAGAEAIAVDGHRLGAASAFEDAAPTVELDGSRLRSWSRRSATRRRSMGAFRSPEGSATRWPPPRE